MATHILLCTVGGSHEPIVASIAELKRRASRDDGEYLVCFICSESVGRRPGSIDYITGECTPIEVRRGGEIVERLQNIPTLIDLPVACFEICVVHPDNLDDAYIKIRRHIRDLREKKPGARFVADYTGGTKTMTSALVCAALESDDVDLQVVIGTRVNLVGVSPGTPHGAGSVHVPGVLIDRAVARHLRLWERFAYHQAARTLQCVPVNAGTPEQERALLARHLSEVLALWDDFNHKSAAELLDMRKGDVMSKCSKGEKKLYGNLVSTIGLLGNHHHPKREVLQLFDLWLNAKRRAVQGRFDDAVARWYRLMEWTAQWLLKTVLEIQSTAEFPRKELPEGVEVAGPQDPVQIGLRKAWLVVKGRFDGDARGVEGVARRFIDHNDEKLRHLVQKRNYSLLAHGFKPVTKEDWEEVESFTEEHVVTVLREALRVVEVREAPKQLPQSPPDFLMWP